MSNSDLTGQIFGFWTVLEKHGYDSSRELVFWLCRCFCGLEKKVSGTALRTGRSKACHGCATKERNKRIGSNCRLRPYEALFNTLGRKADGRTIEVGMSYQDFVDFTANTKCHYCLAPIVWRERNVGNSPGPTNLDRVDNTIGYTKENCVPCCWRCNSVKGKFLTYAQMEEVGLLIQKWEGRLG